MRTFTYTVEELDKLADDYIAKCEQDGEIPLLQEFGRKIGLTNDMISLYMNNGKYAQYSDPVKKVKEASELYLVKNVIKENKPIGKMFILKANHGYVEKQHVEHSGTFTIGTVLDSLESGKNKPALTSHNNTLYDPDDHASWYTQSIHFSW